MMFLDEKIAEMQKYSKKYIEEKTIDNDINEDIEDNSYLDNYMQEDINKAIKSGSLQYENIKLDFDYIELYDARVKMCIPIKYFTDKVEFKDIYAWKKHKDVTLGIFHHKKKNKKTKMVKFEDLLKYILKREKIFIECVEFIEKDYGEYKKYIVQLRIPTKDGYIDQYIVLYDLKKDHFIFNLSFKEDKKLFWKKIAIGMFDLIEINDLGK